MNPEDYTNFATKVEAPRSLPSAQDRELPEAQLERQIRADIQRIDGTLLQEPVYSQRRTWRRPLAGFWICWQSISRAGWRLWRSRPARICTCLCKRSIIGCA
ncbi:MAG: hypothetical protein WDO18_18500 [Acidobacteriota bacterium]